jgi:hypothetical protein
MFNWLKKKVNSQNQSTTLSVKKSDEAPAMLVRYKYVWRDEIPMNERDTQGFESREFCKYFVNTDKLYSRVEIEQMSVRLGYDVFGRAGGDECRHKWEPMVVTEKI